MGNATTATAQASLSSQERVERGQARLAEVTAHIAAKEQEIKQAQDELAKEAARKAQVEAHAIAIERAVSALNAEIVANRANLLIVAGAPEEEATTQEIASLEERLAERERQRALALAAIESAQHAFDEAQRKQNERIKEANKELAHLKTFEEAIRRVIADAHGESGQTRLAELRDEHTRLLAQHAKAQADMATTSEQLATFYQRLPTELAEWPGLASQANRNIEAILPNRLRPARDVFETYLAFLATLERHAGQTFDAYNDASLVQTLSMLDKTDLAGIFSPGGKDKTVRLHHVRDYIRRAMERFG